MQRASGSASTPPTTPNHVSKRQRISSGSSKAVSNITPRSASGNGDGNTLGGAEEGEGKARNDEAPDETEWYLSIPKLPSPANQPPLRVVSAGYSVLDSVNDATNTAGGIDASGSERRRRTTGRLSFGGKRTNGNESPTTDSTDQNDKEDVRNGLEDPSSAADFIAAVRKEAGDKARAERKAKRKLEQTAFAQQGKERRQKQMKMNSPGG